MFGVGFLKFPATICIADLGQQCNNRHLFVNNRHLIFNNRHLLTIKDNSSLLNKDNWDKRGQLWLRRKTANHSPLGTP
jgi:hypothetical protein